MLMIFGQLSSRWRTFRVSGSEKALLPLKTSAQEFALVPIPLDQRKSWLRLTSTPWQGRPRFGFLFFLHHGSPVGDWTYARPSGFTRGRKKISSVSTSIRMVEES